MKRFIFDIRTAIAGPSFVQIFKERSFGDGVWFLVKLSLIQSVVLAGIVLINIVPPLTALSERDLVSEFYPEGLEVKLVDGVASTNVEEPFFVSAGEQGEEGFSNAFVIDTSAENPIATLDEYDTMVLLTARSLAFQKSSGEVRVLNLKDVNDMTVSKESVSAFIKDMTPIAYVVGIILSLFALGFVIVFSVLYYLALAALLALLVLLVSAIRKFTISYGQAYILSLYAFTLPILVDSLFDIFSLANRFWLTLGIFMVVILFHTIRHKEPMNP